MRSWQVDGGYGVWQRHVPRWPLTPAPCGFSLSQFLAMVFQDLLTNKDDYLRASRALLREIIKQTKHEINFQAFCLGLMQERKEPQYLEMEFKVPWGSLLTPSTLRFPGSDRFTLLWGWPRPHARLMCRHGVSGIHVQVSGEVSIAPFLIRMGRG